MLRLILSAMTFAFKFVGRMLSATFAFPGRALGAWLGVPSPGDVPEVAPPEDLDVGLETTADNFARHEAIANLIRLWCADSLIDDRPAPVPPSLPRAIKDWLPGLSRDECATMIAENVDKYAVSAHVRGLYDIAGVRPVGRLPAMGEWPPEPRMASGAGLFSGPACEPAPLATPS